MARPSPADFLASSWSLGRRLHSHTKGTPLETYRRFWSPPLASKAKPSQGRKGGRAERGGGGRRISLAIKGRSSPILGTTLAGLSGARHLLRYPTDCLPTFQLSGKGFPLTFGLLEGRLFHRIPDLTCPPPSLPPPALHGAQSHSPSAATLRTSPRASSAEPKSRNQPLG